MKTPEKFVLRQVMDYLAARHVFHMRLNTAAVQAEHNGKRRFFRAHSLGPGTADILALPQNAPPVWIECKVEGEKWTKQQMLFAHWVSTYGHKYIVAYSVDEITELI